MPSDQAHSLPLSPDLERLIAGEVESGRYRDAGEVVRAALLALAEKRGERSEDHREKRDGEADARAFGLFHRGLTEQAAVGIAHTAFDNRWIALNRAFCDMVGYNREELQALTFTDITHPDDRARDLELVRALDAGEIPSYRHEKRYLRKDGTVIWVLVTVSLLRGEDGRAACRAALIQEITEHKRTVAALAERTAHLSALIEQTMAGVSETNAEGRFIFVNDRYCRLVGRTREELLRLRMHDITHPDDLVLNAPLFRQAMATGEAFEIEKRYIRPDGSIVWVNNSVTPIRLGEGAPSSMFAVTVDVTERKRGEEHQRLLINELNHRVKNTLAIIQGLARQTFRRPEIPDSARRDFEGRLGALSAAHDVLTRQSWEAASIREIVAQAAGAHDPGGGRLVIEGPDLLLPPKTAVSLAMAVHELATNAVKYGGLSGPAGTVEVRWGTGGGRLGLTWRERGGPPVAPPARRGFGTRMIERGLAAELEGVVAIDFHPEGLVCTVEAPLPGPADAPPAGPSPGEGA
ncbi:PAS domain S-box protein [Azospirillum sp. SYSU D00513]|uniref:PAS domain S-box protein n=1 Tax=Azospirillum sp. SYSU D00513 TaxID=2812561 RepID=UPI001A95F5B4|nr:PAS domain S-box protein [Azospirillum sp. SYSU D00513]